MANIHYFQRYHGAENVHTANAFLLINRLFQYKPQYFYYFLDSLVENRPDCEYNFRLNMTLQTKNGQKKGSTVPDAMIVQYGYRLCVETKIGDWFYMEQMEGHLKSFEALDTKYKILLTLSNKNDCSISSEINEAVAKFNQSNKLYREDQLIYVHLTFKRLIDTIESILSDRDYDFMDILEDYREYCFEQGLIDKNYQLMKSVPVGTTLKINKRLNLYYQKAANNIKAKYLGLYTNRKIVAIGEITKVITASMPEDKVIVSGKETATEEELNKIKSAILDASEYNYNLKTVEHNFFFVERFAECSFEKTSKGGLLGSKLFELESDYGIENIESKTIEEIAGELSQKTWV